MRNDEKILLTKGKIVNITEDPVTKDVILEGEDILSGKKIRRTFDMAVLATGMQPNTSVEKVPGPSVSYDEFGFMISEQGIHRCRCLQETYGCRHLFAGCYRSCVESPSGHGGEVSQWTTKSEFTLIQVTGLGEALDIDALSAVATDEFKVAVCRAEPYWSDPDKLAIIRNDIANEGLTAVIIAGPSPRVFQKEFTFDGVITERMNLREHVVWCHPANDEDTQMLAEDYMRMGITKTSKYEDDRPSWRRWTKAFWLSAAG